MVVGMVPILSSADASAEDDWILISSGKELKDGWKGPSNDQKFKRIADIELGDKLEATSGKKTFILVPADYKKTLDGLKVTNTYQISQIKVIDTKVWEGGPDPRPDIVLQLYLGDQAVQELVTLKSGTTTHTREVTGTDEKGQALVYTVKEVQVPADYEVSYSEDTLTITNTHSKVGGGDEDTKTPATGQGVSPYLYLGVLLVLLGLLAAVFGKRAFKKKD